MKIGTKGLAALVVLMGAACSGDGEGSEIGDRNAGLTTCDEVCRTLVECVSPLERQGWVEECTEKCGKDPDAEAKIDCVSRASGCDEMADCDDARACDFECPGSDVCLPERWVCDLEADCPGGEDEVDCPCDFDCGGGACIPQDWVCDGEADCDGGEDEVDCGDGG